MDDAKEEDSKALEDLVKRPCWHAINNALPFIVARHWGEMVEDSDGRMKCGPSFSIDKQDIKLTLLMANAQMAFQKHFFLDLDKFSPTILEQKVCQPTNIFYQPYSIFLPIVQSYLQYSRGI
jgi:hypothetical protein